MGRGGGGLLGGSGLVLGGTDGDGQVSIWITL